MTYESSIVGSLAQHLVDSVCAHVAIYTQPWNQLDALERDRLRRIAEHALTLVMSGQYPPDAVVPVESKDYTGVVTGDSLFDFAVRTSRLTLACAKRSM